MGRRLCIVARDQPLLWGYLTTALSGDPEAGEDIDVVLDRREGQPQGAEPLLPALERRRLDPEAEEMLRTQGYVVISLDRDDPAALGPAQAGEAPHEPGAEGPAPARPAYARETPVLSRWTGLIRRPDRQVLRRGAIRAAAVAAVLAVVTLGVHLFSRPLVPVHAPRSSASPGGVAARETVPILPTELTEPILPSEPAPAVSVNHVDVIEPVVEVRPAKARPADPRPAEVRPTEPGPTGPKRSVEPAPVSPAPVPGRAPAPRPAPAAIPKDKKVVAAATRQAEPRGPQTPTPPPPVALALNPFPELPWIRLTAAAQPSSQGRRIAYTLSLRGRAGKPVLGAEVSVHGRLPDGSLLDSRLEPVKPGTYRVTVPLSSGEPSGLRVKVILDGRRYDIPVS